MSTNKFKVLDDLSEETFEKKSKDKQGDYPHLEKMEITSKVGDEATKENPQEVGDQETREEEKDMDIGSLYLEGMKQA